MYNMDGKQLLRDPERKKLVRQQLMHFAIMIVVDVGIPLALYYGLRNVTSQLVALLVSGIPPALFVIFTFIVRRQIDALGCLFVFCYIFSAILSIISGDARLAMLRDSTITCVISCAFFISLVPIRTRWFDMRPLTYMFGLQMVGTMLPLAKWTDKDGEKHEQIMFEFLWDHVKVFRWHNYIMTGLWAIALMGEFVAKLIMIESTLSVDDIVWISNVIVIVVVVVLSVLSAVTSVAIRKISRKQAMEWIKENDYSKQFEQANNNDAENSRDNDQSPPPSPFDDEHRVANEHDHSKDPNAAY
ncbi:hypothetical protein BC940DRAFT_254542 [Gongronella butleri]|nr:hypothetical protein BC940DRAFT_254542 [Gongronella butleri]